MSNLEKTKINKKLVYIDREKLKKGLTKDRYVRVKLVNPKKAVHDYYLPVVKLLSQMIDKNLK